MTASRPLRSFKRGRVIVSRPSARWAAAWGTSTGESRRIVRLKWPWGRSMHRTPATPGPRRWRRCRLTTSWRLLHATRSDSGLRPGTSTTTVSKPRHSKTSTLGSQSPRPARSTRSNSTRRPMSWLSSWWRSARSGWPGRDGFLMTLIEAPPQVEYRARGGSRSIALNDYERAVVGGLGPLGETVELAQDLGLQGGRAQLASLTYQLGQAGVAELHVVAVPGLRHAVREHDQHVSGIQPRRRLLVLALVEEPEHHPARGEGVEAPVGAHDDRRVVAGVDVGQPARVGVEAAPEERHVLAGGDVLGHGAGDAAHRLRRLPLAPMAP